MSSSPFSCIDFMSSPGIISNVYNDVDGCLVVVVRQEYRFRFRGAAANVNGSTVAPRLGRWRDANAGARTLYPTQPFSQPRSTSQAVTQDQNLEKAFQFQASAQGHAMHQAPSKSNGIGTCAPVMLSERDETSNLSSSERDALGTLLEIFDQSTRDVDHKPKKRKRTTNVLNSLRSQENL